MWLLRVQAALDSEEESEEEEEKEEEEEDDEKEKELRYQNRFLFGSPPPDEGFSYTLGEWFIKRGKKRSHPQDLGWLLERGEGKGGGKREKERGFDDCEGGRGSRRGGEEEEEEEEKKEPPNLANPSRCVEELRGELSDAFLRVLKDVLKTSPLEFINRGGIPVLVRRIVKSFGEGCSPKRRKDLVCCFFRLLKGWGNSL